MHILHYAGIKIRLSGGAGYTGQSRLAEEDTAADRSGPGGFPGALRPERGHAAVEAWVGYNRKCAWELLALGSAIARMAKRGGVRGTIRLSVWGWVLGKPLFSAGDAPRNAGAGGGLECGVHEVKKKGRAGAVCMEWPVVRVRGKNGPWGWVRTKHTGKNGTHRSGTT